MLIFPDAYNGAINMQEEIKQSYYDKLSNKSPSVYHYRHEFTRIPPTVPVA